ncbi:hypothetical protein F2P56_009606 [Juglans regia]|uniref:Protein DELAY OF GERMINATION 1-like n=2 Tax=Juglans regia TaxID=51240 RepID=A0A2I4DJ63_JUGRE|nr:protein DELAY OF GERMINATION 1-like [Juglans regia]KAF5472951.1 hypothetical protein F2P56_009606 [Juglans regia]
MDEPPTSRTLETPPSPNPTRLSMTDSNEHNLSQLAQKCIKHFQDYADMRSQLAHNDVSAFFISPCWCTDWENCMLWLSGCRPSQYIRLVYALSGLEIAAQLDDSNSPTHLGSRCYIRLINMLQGKTIRSEEKLTARIESLQEDVEDQPIAVIVKGLSWVGEMNGEVNRALDKHKEEMAGILEEMYRLRLSTLKELVGILMPKQAVDFLVVGKKLHLCVQEWGKRREDLRHDREEIIS